MDVNISIAHVSRFLRQFLRPRLSETADEFVQSSPDGAASLLRPFYGLRREDNFSLLQHKPAEIFCATRQKKSCGGLGATILGSGVCVCVQSLPEREVSLFVIDSKFQRRIAPYSSCTAEMQEKSPSDLFYCTRQIKKLGGDRQ